MELLEKSMPKEFREEAPPVASISSLIASSRSKETPAAIESTPSPSANTTQSKPEVAIKNLEGAFRSVEPPKENPSEIPEQKISQVEPESSSLPITPDEPTFAFSLARAFDSSNRDMQEVARLSEPELPTYEFGTESGKVRARMDLSSATGLLDSGISSVQAPTFLKGATSTIPNPTSVAKDTQELSEMNFEFSLEPAFDQQDPILREVAGCLVASLPSYDFQTL
ncbi:hypothetical protein K493DRAFT_90791 [Basidiobolus meristosporus CBS 931.73]|uniref:Uncharacterized protein n=1 Tax=Basidiobolus meristosporus CBS 931.73 TaxID=1314790 RepID=A0A1Y1YUH8_9FUNG|nr:hypothetical protein K493DRAFT_90791 [Basidiobolus meristosporus CBS 931.73]|eukprot:ORY01692.1 hypothetical protein K493DRAFT_90791 [Basidiobolus meristosporus CBS 931.73]